MKFIKTSILCLATVAAAACHKSEAPTAADGTITFAVAAQQEVNDVTRSKVSDITDLPAAADFTLTITDAQQKTARTLLPQANIRPPHNTVPPRMKDSTNRALRAACPSL